MTARLRHGQALTYPMRQAERRRSSVGGAFTDSATITCRAADSSPKLSYIKIYIGF
jgi:hypothetical protein